MVSTKTAKPATVGIGSRKARWQAEFKQLIAKLKRIPTNSIEFVKTYHRAIIVAGCLDHKRWQELDSLIPTLVDPALSAEVEKLRKLFDEQKDDAGDISILWSVHPDASSPDEWQRHAMVFVRQSASIRHTNAKDFAPQVRLALLKMADRILTQADDKAMKFTKQRKASKATKRPSKARKVVAA